MENGQKHGYRGENGDARGAHKYNKEIGGESWGVPYTSCGSGEIEGRVREIEELVSCGDEMGRRNGRES